jgi:hypothetical protein
VKEGEATPFGTYSLGIHSVDIARCLAERGAVRIIGYRRSGKSTLAETLASELRREGHHVLVQNASRWLGDRAYVSGVQGGQSGDATVDPEVRLALAALHGRDRPTWIVDDADVLVAYASDDALAAIGRQVSAGYLSLVAIRNRFVVEGGSLRHREALLAPAMPSLELDALDPAASLEACALMMRGGDRVERARWLSEMSGGVPGLISDLKPLCPPGGPRERHQAMLMRMVDASRRELSLGDGPRAVVLDALCQGTLPPLSLLTPASAAEAGALIAAGMVHTHYWRLKSPFRGHFWSLVAGAANEPPNPSLGASESVGLELENAIRVAGLHEPLMAALELEGDSDGALAIAFSQALYWTGRERAPTSLLQDVLAECLGVVHLRSMLRRWRGEQPSHASSSRELAHHLIELASHR